MKTTTRKAHEGQARAKYNFLAQTHLELSLAKGELVVITRRIDDNWLEGKIGGRKGSNQFFDKPIQKCPLHFKIFLTN